MRTTEEEQLVAAIIDYCRLRHLLVTHFRPCRTAKGWRTAVQGDPGFPDLVIAGPHGTTFAECKTRGRKPEPAQQKWLATLGNCAALNVFVWTRTDWDQGDIKAHLDWLARGRVQVNATAAQPTTHV